MDKLPQPTETCTFLPFPNERKSLTRGTAASPEDREPHCTLRALLSVEKPSTAKCAMHIQPQQECTSIGIALHWQTEHSPALPSGNLPKLSNGDTGNSFLPAVELLSHSSYHTSGLQCFPLWTRKHSKRGERDSPIRRATRREWKMKDARKQNVVQP